MLKSFILAATSIACMLSISSIADAGDRRIDRHPTVQNRLRLISTQPESRGTQVISSADIKIISRVITEFYKSLNQKSLEMPSGSQEISGGIGFYEAKKINLTAFDGSRNLAEIEVIETERSYSFTAKRTGVSTTAKSSGQNQTNKRIEYTFKKSPNTKLSMSKHIFSLSRQNGGWKIENEHKQSMESKP
jgi:hypothetical protein